MTLRNMTTLSFRSALLKLDQMRDDLGEAKENVRQYVLCVVVVSMCVWFDG